MIEISRIEYTDVKEGKPFNSGDVLFYDRNNSEWGDESFSIEDGKIVFDNQKFNNENLYSNLHHKMINHINFQHYFKNMLNIMNENSHIGASDTSVREKFFRLLGKSFKEKKLIKTKGIDWQLLLDHQSYKDIKGDSTKKVNEEMVKCFNELQKEAIKIDHKDLAAVRDFIKNYFIVYKGLLKNFDLNPKQSIYEDAEQPVWGYHHLNESIMGEGVNVQNRLIALHHVDAPWTPSAVEQRDGRIVRFGNESKFAKIYIYTTQDSFDLFLWNLLKIKNEQFSKILKGGEDIRRFDFEVDPTYAQTAAITSGNPKIKEKLEIEHEIIRLNNLLSHHNDSVFFAKSMIKAYKTDKDVLKESIEKHKNVPDIQNSIWTLDLSKYGFKSEYEGDREKMLALVQRVLNSQQLTKVDGMQFGGVPVAFSRTYNAENGKFSTCWYMDCPPYLERRNAADLQKLLMNKEEQTQNLCEKLKETEDKVEKHEKLLEVPFEHEEKLARLQKRSHELDFELENKGENGTENGEKEDQENKENVCMEVA